MSFVSTVIILAALALIFSPIVGFIGMHQIPQGKLTHSPETLKFRLRWGLL